MLDLLLHSAYPGRHFGGFLSGRCPRCGEGMIVSSDGFMMVRCDNCGRYLANDPNSVGFGVLSLKTTAKDLFQRAKRSVASRFAKSGAASALPAPEGT
jgi:ribosomal protein S27E